MAIVLTPDADAVELAYTWKTGDQHRYRYRDATTFDMTGALGYLAPNVQLGTETIFSEQVKAVASDGTATLDLTIESMVLSVRGTPIATLCELPEDVRQITAQVDRKGNVTLNRRVTAWLANGTVYLATGDDPGADETDPEGTWRVFTKVDAHSGQVTRIHGDSAPIPGDAVSVEALPVDLFDMMVLPDLRMDPGETLTISVPGVEMATTLTSHRGAIADLSLHVGTSIASALAAAPGMGSLPDLSSIDGQPDLDTTPGIGAPLMGIGASGTRADLELRFDTEAGRLLQANGTFSMSTGMGEVGGVSVDSRMALTRL